MSGILTKLAKAASAPAKREDNLAKFLEPSKVQQRLYHGTMATEGGKRQEAVRRLKPSKEGALGSGVYLTPDSEFASTYAGFPARSQLERDIATGSDFAKESAKELLDRMNRGAVESHEIGGNMLPVYAQLKNPLILEGKGDPMIEALVKLGVDEDKATRMVERAYDKKGYIGKEVETRARAAGYDGLMQHRDGKLTEVVAYNPNAVKSAIGNQGTYDITQPELSKAAGGLMEHLDPGYEAESIRRFMDEERKKKVDQPSGGAAFGVYPSSGKGRKYGPVSRALDTGQAQTALAKGLTMMPQNLAGMPVDLVNLALSPLGLASEKPVMGSDWLKEQSRRAGVAFAEPQDPTLKGFFTAGDLASNLINPAAATRSVASGAGKVAGAVAPKAAEMAEGYLQASGLAPTVVKPKGGNWVTGSVDRQIQSIKAPVEARAQELSELREIHGELPRYAQAERQIAADNLLNNWIDQKLNKYIRNEMGTPEDPVRALAERGILHFEPQGGDLSAHHIRRSLNMPAEPTATSPLARAWENRSDSAILGAPYRDLIQYESDLTEADLLRKIGGEYAVKNPDARAYVANPGVNTRDLGFDHLIDELRNATRPDSDLPARLRWKPEDLQKVTMEQAVRRVHEINEYRAAKKAEANEVLARNPATAPYRDYETVPGTQEPNSKGLSWKQIQAPKDIPLPDGYKVVPDAITNRKTGTIDNNGFRLMAPDGELVSWGQSEKEAISAGFGKKYLEDALKYEGDVMGHCVGGYCDDVLSGQSQIFSLRDKKGEPHVTIEVRPSKSTAWEEWLKRNNSANPNLEEMNEFRAYLKQRAEEIGEGSIDTDREFLRWASLTGRTFPEPAPEIIQIKGKGNRAPNAEYLPFVQDFVRSGNWSRVGDFSNTGLFRKSDFINEFTPAQLDSIGKGEYLTMNEIKKLREGKNWKPIDTDPDLDVDFNLLRAKGGEVHAAGGGLMEYLDPGYEAEVIRRKGDTALDLHTTNLTPQERDLAPRRRPTPAAPLAQATALNEPSMRERHAAGAEKFLRTITPRAGAISGVIFGGEKSPLPLGLGIADFPVLSPYLPEEAGFMVGEGAGTGSAAQAAMGAGLGALSVLPFAKPAATAVKAAGKAVAPAVGQMAEGYLQSTGLAPSIVAKPNRFGFFSAAEEAALTTPRKSGPGQGFLNDLRKAGVSKNELEPTGIAEFLQSSPNVTREEVQQFVKQNKPDVQVKTLTDPTTHPNQDILAEYGLKYDHIFDQIGPIDRPIGELRGDEASVFRRWYDTESMGDPAYANWVREMEDIGQEIYRSMPKFDRPELSLPGGNNYREMSLNLRGPEAYRVPGPHSFGSDEADINRIAHIRMNDRVDADGKKVLFIEELQSDWGQQGKNQGFADNRARANLQREIEALGIKKPIMNVSLRDLEQAGASKDLQNRFDAQMLKGASALPTAPFVTKTNDWVDLGLKHILKTAANEGYDRVAFINGTQSADRYDLSKRVDQLLYKKNDDGTYKISAQAGGRGNMIGERISEDKLADYVGKDVADKIVSDTGVRINLGGSSVSQPEDMWGSLSGEGLRVGGEGMKNFYDKIVPGQVNALLKKFGGGKLSDIQIPTEGGVLTQPGFDITPELRKKLAEPMSYAEGGAVNMADTIAQQLQSSGMDADKALMHALRMQAAKDAEPVTVAHRPEIDGAEDFKQAVMQKFAVGGAVGKLIAKGSKSMAEKEGAAYTELLLKNQANKMAEKISADNLKLTDEQVAKKALDQASKKLTWERQEKPALEKTYGALERAKFNEPLQKRQRNVPEVVKERSRKAQEFLSQPVEPWQPPPAELQAFDRERIKDALEGFPGIQQTKFPRYEPARADLSYIDEIYSDPINRDLIKKQITRGLPLGGETFYASLYPLKLASLERGIPEEKFNQFVYSIAPASARNSILNEVAVGQFLRDMKARGLSLDEATVKQEMAAFKEKYGIGLPLMPIHREGVQKVLEGPIDLRAHVMADIPTNYKIPTYGTQKAGDFGKSVVLDVHEAAGETQGSRYHPYFTEQGGFGPTEYGLAENKMLDIAGEMGIPGGMAQAGRWFGGGELTGLKSPRGDALDLLEKQAAYTLQGQGIKPTPRVIREYLLNMIDTGEGVMMPYFKSTPLPDVRTVKKEGGLAQAHRK